MNNGTKKFIGWVVILLISISPALLWYYFGDGASKLSGYSELTHSIGEISGLIGMTMFALTFVLSTRIKKIEDVFGGLDKVYIVHGILGGTALVLILMHPLFLVLKFIPANMALASKYLLPSSSWAVNYGIVALLGMIGLIFVTLFTKLKYNRWKFTHEFLGAMFIFAVFHIYMVRGTVSQDNIFTGYSAYAFIVSAIGILAFSWSLFLKNRLVKNAVYVIDKINMKKDFFEIEMVPEHKPLSYKSGQFIFVRFYNENLSKEAHPFSIASKSNAEKITIIVKKLGDYTSRLERLNIGDKVSIEGPYGRFNFSNSGKDQVWIAAGIGITPFLGMVQDLENMNIKVDLYYTVREDSDFIGYNLLTNVASRIKRFNFIPWNSTKNGRIKVDVIEKKSSNIGNMEFFLCGPEAFKEDIIKGLIAKGVKKSRIHEEAFEFR